MEKFTKTLAVMKRHLHKIGLTLLGILAGTATSSAINYEDARSSGTIAAYTNFILKAELKDVATRNDVEKAFCDLYDLDSAVAESLAEDLEGYQLSPGFEVRKFELRNCAVSGAANMYII